jgi:hypothetical protein
MARKKVEDTTPREDVPEIIPCAHESCGISAITRVKTPTGWAKFCLEHYEDYFKRLAAKNFTALGLDRWPNESYDDWRARISEYTKLIVKKMPLPADDHEEAA